MDINMLSVLVPVYNEEECFLLLYERLSCVLSKLPCKSEILFVNDGSKDNSLLLMKEVLNGYLWLIYHVISERRLQWLPALTI